MNMLESPHINDLQELLWEYRESLKCAENAYYNADSDDKKIISGMISDCKYVIDWLHTGRRPGNRRGIERRAGYEREIPVEPNRMQRFSNHTHVCPEARLSDDQRALLEFALEPLSRRERECYMLAHGEGFSHATVAEMLGISAGSVSEYIQRAQRKITPLVAEVIFVL
ncbi:sigma factor-like helix-turn-helix DNA-binding protein [Paenibacillus pedocola]|uniref:sigma factor-like helix-turn-helix DNA-binding protein n=1 Tax=Paenibacillus pedocola TaxID=3242193 RepID=UPI002878040F|nr:sigma factor-like helix-turn-helix DNA-binding protein [Paenibacillus typhae]